MTLLDIVSVNYFGSDSVSGLVESLKAQDRPDWRLVVVDNSESDAEADQLRRIAATDARVDVAVAPGNLGYFGGADWWLRSSEISADWLAVCNADVVLDDPGFLSTLAALTPSADVVGPAITAMPSGRQQNPFLRGRPSARGMLLRRLAFSTPLSAWSIKKLSVLRRSARSEARESAREIYAPHGAFVLFNRSFFAAGGSLQHPPFLYGEEITVGERARRLGLVVRHEPELSVVHNENQATGKVSRRVFVAQRDAAVYAHELIKNSSGTEQLGTDPLTGDGDGASR